MTQFTISLVQLNTQDDLAANIRAVESYVRESARKGAELICLPENTFIMRAQEDAQYSDQGEGVETCRKLAQELGVWILIGSIKTPATGGKFYNRSLLINASGDIVAQYDKIHLFDVTLKNGETYHESARIEGGQKAVIAQTPWGKLGMTVCYDVRFPHLYRTLAQAGADFLCVPAAFTYTTGSAHWHTLLRSRAIETGCYVLAPAQCGTHPGSRRTYGHSLAFTPWGELIAEAPEAEAGITLVQVDTDKIREARSMVPSLTHDRGFGLTTYE
ncbi:MAG TPA: carbon-nitrogen hydrolase family protein [Rickettsiales bacterium]|nr:carbon-nitrogen hydrolase family protein [Rickettsiales bacterium]